MIAGHQAVPTSLPSSSASSKSAGMPEPSALRALLGFHRSIRAALQALDELAAISASVDGDKAAKLHDFFRWPMRWHDEDEAKSLMPRLLAADSRLAAAVTACAAEHAAMEALLDSILIHLHDVSVGAATPDAALLTTTARQLRAVLEPHLRREETELFPIARALLSPGDFADIASEMRVRRLRRARAMAKGDAPSR